MMRKIISILLSEVVKFVNENDWSITRKNHVSLKSVTILLELMIIFQ